MKTAGGEEKKGILMRTILRCFCRGFGFLVWVLFHTANVASAELASLTIQPNQKVLILGDSIAAPGMYSHAANEILLAAGMESPPLFASFGKAGATAQSILADVPRALENGPYDWILVNFGQNDANRFSADEFKEHSRKLLALLREKAPLARLGWISLIGVEPTAWADDPLQAKRGEKLLEGRRKSATIAVATRELCEEEGILYVPLFESVEQILRERRDRGLRISFTMDSVHPNLAGYWVYGAALMRSLGFRLSPMERDVLQADAFSDQGRLMVDTRSAALALGFEGLFLNVRLIPPPTDEIVSRRRTILIDVDGNLAEWSDVPRVRIAPPLHVTMECVPGSARTGRYAAALQSVYDEANLYFALHVTEPNTENGNWFQEIVEIFIDGRSDPSPSGNVWRKTPGLTQYCFHRDFSGVKPRVGVTVNGDNSQAEGITAAAQPEPGGYTLEIAIPLRNFKQVAFSPGFRCPFDWAVSFTDQALNLDWMGLMSRSSSTRGYGWLILEALGGE